MTHAELVVRAARWLRNTKRCPIVATELVTGSAESPDAIGWHPGYSILVECKISRADFRTDQLKSFRMMPKQGMGDQRFYMTPPGLLLPDELPEQWGLLECSPTKVRVIRDCADPERPWTRKVFENNLQEERRALISIIRRLKGEYTYPVKRTEILLMSDD